MRQTADNIIHVDLEDVPESTRDAVVVFRLLVAVSGRMRVLMDRQLADAGLTTQQATLLTIVRNLDPPPTQTDVATMMGTSHQNIRQIASALERKGLLETRTDDDDRRVRRMAATAATRPFFAERNERDYQAVQDWFSPLDPEQVGTLRELLERLMDSLP